jgi:hypothetical protein
MTRKIRAAVLVVLSACTSATTPAPTPTAPATVLAYSMPSPATATYAYTDSSRIVIQAGAMGTIQMSSSATATTDITYTQKTPNLEATIRVTDFDGSFENSATGGRSTANESQIEGPAVLSVGPRGETTITSLPKLSTIVQSAGLNPGFFRSFFVRLPAGAVRPGVVWVDTVHTSDGEGGTNVSVDDVVTSTFVRDTVVGGRTLALITTSAQRAVNISGSSDGATITQRLTGPGTGRALWDIERGLLVERSESWELSGTFDLPQMGISGLPVTAHRSGKLAMK